MRWLALVLILVASPCATELALGSVAAAFSESAAVTDSCCCDRSAQDEGSDQPASPDDSRSNCGCCHSFNPPTLATMVFSSVRLAAPRVADASEGKTDDGHTEPPFRPPAL